MALSSGHEAIALDIAIDQFSQENCLAVHHSGFDGVTEYLDEDGEVLWRAGSWMGTESRYLLRPPESDKIIIRIRSFNNSTNIANLVRIGTCPSVLPSQAVRDLTAAQNLRLARYFGAEVSSREIEHLLSNAVSKLQATDGVVEWRAVAHYEKGAFLRSQDRLEQAAVNYAAALDLFTGLELQPAIASTLNALGLLRWRQGDLDSAEDLFNQALLIRFELDDVHGEATVANNLGLIHAQSGREEQALEYYEIALSLFQGGMNLRASMSGQPAAETLGDRNSAMDLGAALNTLHNLAFAHYRADRLEVAKQYWRNYLALSQHVPRAAARAEAQIVFSALLARQGLLDEALKLAIDAMNQFTRLDAKRWMTEAHRQLADLYAMIGDRAVSKYHLELGSELVHEDVLSLAQTQRALGRLLLGDGDLNAGRAAFQEAARLYQSASDSAMHLGVRGDIAWLDHIAGDSLSALEALQGLTDDAREKGLSRLQSELRSRVGAILLGLGRPELARSELLEALEGHRQTGDRLMEFETLARLSDLYRVSGDPAEMEVNEQAISIFELLHADGLPALRQAELLARSRQVFDHQVKALVADGQFERAWQVAESARARGLRGLLRSRQYSLEQQTRSAMLNRRSQLVHQRFEQRQYVDPTGNDSDDRELHRLAVELDRVEAELSRHGRERATIPTPSLAELQVSLQANQILLSYYLGTDFAVAWLIRPDSARVIELGDLSDLESMIGELITGVRHPRHGIGRVERIIADLRERLLYPLAMNGDPAKEIFIQLDGFLHSLPLSLLFSDSMPALTQFMAGFDGESSPAVEGNPEGLLIMADPGWQQADINQQVYPENSLIGRLIRDQSLGGLPGTRREAEAIAKLSGAAGNVQLRLGYQATRDFVVNGGLSGYRQIHIATHGLVDLDYPDLSSLLLASENSLGPWFLRPHEIVELDLNADLVVLSGCETGLGKMLVGEGTLSLARPFLIAGARQVLSSLWKIDDHHTAEFMQRFYQHLLNDGDSAAGALSRAQNWMRRQPGTAHPYYWAGFILIQA